MNNILRTLAIAVGSAVGTLFLTLLISYPAMLLWNSCLQPAIPALAQINWLQSWGIVFLINLVAHTSVKFEGR